MCGAKKSGLVSPDATPAPPSWEQLSHTTVSQHMSYGGNPLFSLGCILGHPPTCPWVTTNTLHLWSLCPEVAAPVAGPVVWLGQCVPAPQSSSSLKGEHVCDSFHVTTWPSREQACWLAPSFLELDFIESGCCQGVARQTAWQQTPS